MIETNSSRRARDAYRRAHARRGEALADLVRLIFNRDAGADR